MSSLYQPSTNRSESNSFNFDADVTRTRLIVGWICIVAYLIVFVPSMTMFWLRRNKFPISKRFPYQTIAMQFFVAIWIISNVSRILNLIEFPCAAVIWGESAGVCIAMVLLNIRLLGLAHRYYKNMAQVDEFWRPNWKALKNDSRMAKEVKAASPEADKINQDSTSDSSHSTQEVTSAPTRSMSFTVSIDNSSAIGSDELDSKTVEIHPFVLGCIPIQAVKKFALQCSWLERMKYSIPLFILFLMIILIPHTIFIATDQEIREAPYVACGKDLSVSKFIAFAEAALFVLTFIIMGLFILPKIVDSIEYRTEMILITILAIASMLAYGILMAFPFLKDYDRWVFPLYQPMLTPLAILLNVVQIGLPVLLSYYNESSMLELLGIRRRQNTSFTAISGRVEALSSVDAEQERKNREALTLKDILSSPKLVRAFQKFLQSEFAQESLYFLVEAEEFRYMAWNFGKAVYKNKQDYSYRVPSLALTGISPLSSLPEDVVHQAPLANTNNIRLTSIQTADPNDLVYEIEALKKAFGMIHRYLLRSSPLELNIPASIIGKEIQSLINIYLAHGKDAADVSVKEKVGVSVHVFDEIQQHVFEALSLGSWPRFKRSPMFQSVA